MILEIASAGGTILWEPFRRINEKSRIAFQDVPEGPELKLGIHPVNSTQPQTLYSTVRKRQRIATSHPLHLFPTPSTVIPQS